MLFFSFQPTATPQQRQSMLQDFAAVAASFPQIKKLELGENGSRRDDSYTHAMTMQLESFADLDAYLHSERHEAFVATRFRPLVSHRAIVSMAVADPGGEDR